MQETRVRSLGLEDPLEKEMATHSSILAWKILKFLDDGVTYLGNQLESEFGGDRCFGVLANMDFILICSYGAEGADPELVLYKKR